MRPEPSYFPNIQGAFLSTMERERLASVTSNSPELWPHDWPLLTWDTEGSADPKNTFYSRLPHHPSSTSGITIGRGYDMRDRTRGEVLSDLVRASVPFDLAARLSAGAGLSGIQAAAFVQESRAQASEWELSALAEQQLFMHEWQKMHADVRRISEQPEVQRAYGTVDWSTLDPRILEVVVDLRYRGDYTPRSRRFIQPILVKNDLEALAAAISNRALWPDVPEGRFKARQAFLSGF